MGAGNGAARFVSWSVPLARLLFHSDSSCIIISSSPLPSFGPILPLTKASLVARVRASRLRGLVKMFPSRLQLRSAYVNHFEKGKCQWLPLIKGHLLARSNVKKVEKRGSYGHSLVCAMRGEVQPRKGNFNKCVYIAFPHLPGSFGTKHIFTSFCKFDQKQVKT